MWTWVLIGAIAWVALNVLFVAWIVRVRRRGREGMAENPDLEALRARRAREDAVNAHLLADEEQAQERVRRNR